MLQVSPVALPIKVGYSVKLLKVGTPIITVTGRFGPIPVPTPGRFGPIPFRSGLFGPIIKVGRFGPILVSHFGQLYLIKIKFFRY